MKPVNLKNNCAHEDDHEHDHHAETCGCGHAHHEHADCHEHMDAAFSGRVYILENLGCANCAARMEEKIRALPGVKHADITFATKQLRISADSYDGLLQKVQEICVSIESQVKVVEETSEQKAEHRHEHGNRRDRVQILIGAALFMVTLAMERGGLPEMLVLGGSIIAYLILGGGVLLEAGRNIIHGRVFDENFLMCIATLGAFAIREYPEAMGVMLFYRLGEYFEHRAVERSRSQIMQAVDMRPEVVNRIQGKDVRSVPAQEARVGDILLIRPGDRIPLDGMIIAGASSLDTSPITGEPAPIAVAAGDAAISGCINGNGQLKLQVEKPLGESMVTRILNSVENAAASKPKIARFITRFARIYTPCVVAIAFATAVVPPLMGGSWNYWVYTALSFLVMSCPCALVLSVPLAFFSGIGAGSRRGILFKGGAAIETMSQLKAVVVDKTGTITRGDFRLQRVVSAGRLSEDELIAICAGCEQGSSHPIAHSITAAAREQGIAAKVPKDMHEIAGHGVQAVMENGDVLCGNRKLMEMHGVDVEHMHVTGHGSEVFVALNGRLEGTLLVADAMKPDAKSAIVRLKAMGLKIAMLTGDSEKSARAVADEAGIEEVYARLLPDEKLARLQEVRRRYGAAMFVGDGINDAPVLAGADVGAAMGSGADAAIEAADAVFMASSVESIAEAVDIARYTRRIAIQNVVFALAVKLIVMVLGLCGYANMWMAVFADTGVAMLCVLNSVRALYKK